MSLVPGIKQSSLTKLPSKPLRQMTTTVESFVGLHQYDSQSRLFIHVRNGNFYNSISFPDLFLFFPPFPDFPFPSFPQMKGRDLPLSDLYRKEVSSGRMGMSTLKWGSVSVFASRGESTDRYEFKSCLCFCHGPYTTTLSCSKWGLPLKLNVLWANARHSINFSPLVPLFLFSQVTLFGLYETVSMTFGYALN